MKTLHLLGILCWGAVSVGMGAQTIIEGFEYGTDEELLAAWSGSGNTVLTRSDSVALRATGTNSMKATFNFPETAWATESIMGQFLETG